MALLRCPACNRKGEVPGDQPRGRYRCTQCGHRFLVGEAVATGEYNILAEEPPPFLPESAEHGTFAPGDQSRQDWLSRLAEHTGLPADEIVDRALAAYAKKRGFGEPLPPQRGQS